MTTQPKLNIPPTPLDKLLDAVAVVLLILFWVYVISSYDALPDIIPTHFNGAGEANDYGPKSTIFILPGVATFIVILTHLIQFIPHHFNYPIRKITPDNAEFQYRNSLMMVRSIKIGVTLLLFLLTHEIISSVRQNSSTIGPWFWLWLLLLVFTPILVFLVRGWRK